MTDLAQRHDEEQARLLQDGIQRKARHEEAIRHEVETRAQDEAPLANLLHDVNALRATLARERILRDGLSGEVSALGEVIELLDELIAAHGD